MNIQPICNHIHTTYLKLQVHRIEMIEDELKILSENVILSVSNQQFFIENNIMSNLCISADNSVLAVGYENGWIDVSSKLFDICNKSTIF
jgi:hypothetical protein